MIKILFIKTVVFFCLFFSLLMLMSQSWEFFFFLTFCFLFVCRFSLSLFRFVAHFFFCSFFMESLKLGNFYGKKCVHSNWRNMLKIRLSPDRLKWEDFVTSNWTELNWTILFAHQKKSIFPPNHWWWSLFGILCGIVSEVKYENCLFSTVHKQNMTIRPYSSEIHEFFLTLLLLRMRKIIIGFV